MKNFIFVFALAFLYVFSAGTLLAEEVCSVQVSQSGGYADITILATPTSGSWDGTAHEYRVSCSNNGGGTTEYQTVNPYTFSNICYFQSGYVYEGYTRNLGNQDVAYCYGSILETVTGFWSGPSSCGNNWINLSWNAVAGATSYQVYRNGTLIYNGGSLAISDTGLTIGGSYSYTITASNAGGTSPSASSGPTAVANYCGCSSPWGTVAHGYSNTAYSESSPAGACSPQTRTCSNGSMSGSYTVTSCTPGCASTPWGAVTHGYSNTAYQTSSVPYGSSCASQTRTCSSGTLTGSYTATSCSVEGPASCSSPWGTVAHGYSNTAYQSSSVPYGSSCAPQTRTCSNGSMSGSYTATSCSVEGPASCSSPWGTVAHGYSNTAYSASAADVCSSQTRTCSNGSLSGTYSATGCTVNSYNITFNSAGGSAVSTITQQYGTAVSAPANPTRAGFIFAGWSPALASTMPSGGQSLTATWTANPPAIPASLTATPSTCGTGTINLSWSSVSGATSYQVYRNGAVIYNSTGTSHSDTGLSGSTAYTYTVRASNAGGQSGSRATSPAQTTSPLASCNTSANAPTISGPTTGYPSTSYTYTFTATDPQGDQIRYGVDWNMDGTADEWLPAGVSYVSSGTSRNTTYSWTTTGAKTFRALTQDAPGLNSAWTNYSVTISAAPVNGFCGTANRTYPVGSSSYGSDTYCSAGSQSASPAFPAPGASATWVCNGLNGGAPSGTCTASNPQAQHNIVIDATPKGSVDIEGGITCQPGTTDCPVIYEEGTVIYLRAYPISSFWKFSGWSGLCTDSSYLCVLEVEQPGTIIPNFIPRLFDYLEF
ncbi:MAG: InlB B-repeat-containing protein [Patescibacteria group bacterium]